MRDKIPALCASRKDILVRGGERDLESLGDLREALVGLRRGMLDARLDHFQSVQSLNPTAPTSPGRWGVQR